MKRAVVQAASGLSEGGGGEEGARKNKRPTAVAAAAVPPAALALLAEAYSHLALHDDHGEREFFFLPLSSFFLFFTCGKEEKKRN